MEILVMADNEFGVAFNKTIREAYDTIFADGVDNTMLNKGVLTESDRAKIVVWLVEQQGDDFCNEMIQHTLENFRGNVDDEDSKKLENMLEKFAKDENIEGKDIDEDILWDVFEKDGENAAFASEIRDFCKELFEKYDTLVLSYLANNFPDDYM